MNKACRFLAFVLLCVALFTGFVIPVLVSSPYGAWAMTATWLKAYVGFALVLGFVEFSTRHATREASTGKLIRISGHHSEDNDLFYEVDMDDGGKKFVRVKPWQEDLAPREGDRVMVMSSVGVLDWLMSERHHVLAAIPNH